MPYVTVAIIWVVPFHMNYYDINIIEILKYYVLGIAPSQLWFLLELFWGYVLIMALSLRFDFSKIPMYKGAFIFLGIYYISLILSFAHVPDILQIVTALRFLIFFYIGMCLRRWGGGLNSHVVIGFIAFVLSVIIYVYTIDLREIHFGKYIIHVLNPFLNIAGIVAMSYIWGWVRSKLTAYGKIISKLEDGSLVIYLFHQQFIYITNSYFNVEGIWPWQVVAINFCVALIGSYSIFFVAKRFYIARRLLSIKG